MISRVKERLNAEEEKNGRNSSSYETVAYPVATFQNGRGLDAVVNCLDGQNNILL
ncbi:hypothetical protein HPT30_17440 [Paenibacillus sp. JW14]|uniref:Uncharacterized protein n=1 Tax=Paenibacillus agri TaxID=2744309 RepID=A0A850EQV9_9BACL|nr:hypothetical protein [Paenibacillus agri]NUU62129.1 hypothetical protein [Paenibacillus agri]